METFNADGMNTDTGSYPDDQLNASGNSDVTESEAGKTGASKTASSLLNILIGLLDSDVSY